MKWDAIVVGQGIAGTVLSKQLQLRGKKVLVIDQNHQGSSSMVAAGLWNPVTFRKLNKTWIADALLEVAEPFYRALEAELSTVFYHPLEIARIYADVEELNNWSIRVGEKGFDQHLSDDPSNRINLEGFASPNGYGRVLTAGYANLRALLPAYRRHLMDQGALLNEAFEHDALSVHQDGVSYKEQEAEVVFFCEGQRGINNPWFDWLPLQQTKGEVLTVRIEGLNPSAIVNRGFFILPLGEDLYRVGATFNWKEKDEVPTAAGKEELLEKLRGVVQQEIEVVEHVAGLRPTTPDRRPMIGFHPEHRVLGWFNGMGPKGVIYAPYAAQNLLDHWLNQSPLTPDADLARFRKHYQLQLDKATKTS